jgi:hypothetical protein
MRLSASDLALIRDTKAHYTDLYLSVYQPNIVLQCQVNDLTITKGEQNITFDNTTAGTWLNVRTGSTLLVGSSVGARNVGKVRVKNITSSVITVAENSHIEWANNLFLTVLDYFDIWPIFPRIIQDPSNAEQMIWYKDYDILYTDQNVKLGALMNIGPHRAAFIENGSAQLYYSASGTYPLSGSVNQVYWTFQSGTPSTFTGMTPGYVSWGTPGHYLVTCDVSGSTGWGEEAHRYVSIYDHPSAGTNIPISKWEITDLQGSRAEAGYTTSITVYEPVVVEEGSIVVVFADEWYDSTRKSLGGNAPNASTIKFVGYVLDNSIRYDYKSSSVTFDVGSITQVMKDLEGFSVAVNSVATPTDWYELQDMNAKKVIYHYLKWHSNVISLADMEFIGDDFPVQYFDSDRESLFDAVDNFLRTAYHASAVSDRQGKIYFETDAWVRQNATGTYTPLFNLSKYDWIGTPNITEQRMPDLSYLEYNGIAYSGVVTGTYAPLMTNAPGDVPGYRGKSERRTGLALGGQGQLNQLVGDSFAHRNAQYPSIDFPMRGNWSNLDIAPQEVAQTNVAAEDTVRNQAVSGLYMPKSLAWQISSRDKTFMPRVTWGVVTSGEPGETIVIPEVVDDGGFGNRGNRPPIISIPSLPIFSGSWTTAFIDVNAPEQDAQGAAWPAYNELALALLYQSSDGVGTFSISGAFFGNGITLGVTGYYRISLSASIVNEGTTQDVDTTSVDVIVNGARPTTIPKLLAGSYFGTGNRDPIARSGFSIIEPMNAGDQITLGVTSHDGAESLTLSVEARISLEFIR